MSKKRIFRIGMPVLGFAVLGLVGFAFGASAGGFLGHGSMPFGHGGAGMHCLVNQLIDDLNLTEEQQQRLDNLHQALQSKHEEKMAVQGQHHQRLVDQISQGDIDSQEVRGEIDRHLEELKTVAYTVSDELVALINSLDEEQRATLMEHIEKAHGEMAKLHGGCGASSHGHH
jgi:Spy/CpxP family protein refolding chaperone